MKNPGKLMNQEELMEPHLNEDDWKPSTNAKLRLVVAKALEAAGVQVGEAEVLKIAR